MSLVLSAEPVFLMQLPAISLPPLMAQLVAHGAFAIAPLSRRIRGPGAIFIHAGKGRLDAAWAERLGQEARAQLADVGVTGSGDVPTDAVVAVCELVRCVEARPNWHDVVAWESRADPRWFVGRPWAALFSTLRAPLRVPWECEGQRDPWPLEIPGLRIDRVAEPPFRLVMPYPHVPGEEKP